MGASCFTSFLAITYSRSSMAIHSVVVGEFNIFRPFSRPQETNTKLVVDPDRVLTGPVGLQRFQMIARRNLQITKFRAAFKYRNLRRVTPTRSDENPFGARAMKHGFRGPVSKAYNHRQSFVSWYDTLSM
jgi:hypothetical protein